MGDVTVDTKYAEDHFFHFQGETHHGCNPLFPDILRVLEIVIFLDFPYGKKRTLKDLPVDRALFNINNALGRIVLAEAVCGAESQRFPVIIQKLDGTPLHPHNPFGISGGGVNQTLRFRAGAHLLYHFIKRGQLGVALIQFPGHSDQASPLGPQAGLEGRYQKS